MNSITNNVAFSTDRSYLLNKYLIAKFQGMEVPREIKLNYLVIFKNYWEGKINIDTLIFLSALPENVFLEEFKTFLKIN